MYKDGIMFRPHKLRLQFTFKVVLLIEIEIHSRLLFLRTVKLGLGVPFAFP